MASQCYLCGKKSMRGNLVSHSKQRTKRFFRPNLHSFKLLENGITKKVKLCTTCIKTQHKVRKVREEALKAKMEKERLLRKEMHPKIEREEKEIEHEKIPEEVRLEMKAKSKKDKDMDLVEEILSQSSQKEETRKRKTKN